MVHQEAQWESAPLAGHTSAAGTSPRHPSGEARGRPCLEQAGGRFRAMGGRVRRCEPGRFLSDRAAALGLGDGRSVRLCEAGAAVVVKRWLRYELECDDGVHFDTHTWMTALRWLGVAGPPLLERVCKEYVHSTHAPKLESVGWLILRYWTCAIKRAWYMTSWDSTMRTYIRIGLRHNLFHVERVSACIAGDDIFHPPYWATQPVQECLDEWCATH